MVFLKFGEPRRDADLFQSFVGRSQDAAKNAMARPEAVFSDAVQSTLFNNHPRLWLTPRPDNFAALQMERIEAIYRERFSSAQGMTFILVGSFDTEKIKPLVATYLASLPTPNLVPAYVDLGMRPVSGVVKKEVRAGTEPKSLVTIQFTGAATYTEDEALRVKALVEIFNIRVVDVLREKLALIYGGGIGGGLIRAPYQHYQLGLSLPCAPENVEKVLAAAWGEIQTLQDTGPSGGDLAKVQQNWMIAQRKALRENGFWLGHLQSSVLYGTDPVILLDYEKRVAAITPHDIQAAAQRYLRRDNYVEVVMLPEK
jgi:zinc protease